MWRVLLTVGLAASVGCGLFSDKPYLIEGLTVVAVVAEPPEVMAGEETALFAHIVDPGSQQMGVDVRWTYCERRAASESARRCGAAAIELPSDSLESVSFGVFATAAQHSVAPSALAHVVPVIMEAGFWEYVRVEAKSGNDEIQAVKRIVVSTEERPNQNPIFHQVFLADADRELAVEPPYRVAEKTELTLTPDFDADAFEGYRVLNAQGEWEERIEEPTFTWYVTGGTLDPWVSEATEPVTWKLPSSQDAPLILFAVLRDGRGGSAVWFTTVETE